MSGKRGLSLRAKKGAIQPRQVSVRARGRLYHYYTLSGLKRGGKRWQPFYRTKQEAEEAAKVFRTQQKKHGEAASELTLLEWAEVIRCRERLKTVGASFEEAVEYFLKQKNLPTTPGIKLHQALDEMMLWKSEREESGSLSKRTVGSLRGKVRKIKATLKNTPIRNIGRGEVFTFLQNLEFSDTTKKHYRAFFTEFFNYGIQRGWLDANPMALLGKTNLFAAAQKSDPKILTIDETKKLFLVRSRMGLDLCLEYYLALGLFLGLRPNEARGVSGEDIDFDNNSVRVRAEVSKIKKTRYVPLNSTARSWLVGCPRDASPLVKLSDGRFRKQWDRLRLQSGWNVKTSLASKDKTRWEPDVLRHTYGSYWLSVHRDCPRLAEQMGNSTQVVKRFYIKPIPEHYGSLFWKLKKDWVFSPQ